MILSMNEINCISLLLLGFAFTYSHINYWLLIDKMTYLFA